MLHKTSIDYKGISGDDTYTVVLSWIIQFKILSDTTTNCCTRHQYKGISGDDICPCSIMNKSIQNLIG